MEVELRRSSNNGTRGDYPGEMLQLRGRKIRFVCQSETRLPKGYWQEADEGVLLGGMTVRHFRAFHTWRDCRCEILRTDTHRVRDSFSLEMT